MDCSRRGQRYRAASLIDLTSSLIGFVVGVATISRLGAVGLAVGQVARGAVAMLVGLVWARASLRPAYDRAMAREFVAFSAQVASQNLGHYAIGNLPLWSVARLAGGAATGLFARGYALVSLPAEQFSFGLMRAVYPLYREVSGSRDRTRRALTEALVITSGASAVVFGTFAAFVQPAALILLGARWHAAAAIAPMLCAFAAVNTLYAVLASAAEAMRWMRMIWTTQLAFLAAMAVSLFLASGELEATAAAMVIATAIAHVFMLLWVSRDGLLRTAEVLRAYAVHTVLFVVVAVIPPLVSQAVVGQSLIATLAVRTAVLDRARAPAVAASPPDSRPPARAREAERPPLPAHPSPSTASRPKRTGPGSWMTTSRIGGPLGDEGTHLPQPLPLEFPFRREPSR